MLDKEVSERKNVLSFPEIKKNKDVKNEENDESEEKFQVLETTIVVFIKAEKILSFIIKTFFTSLFKIMKKIFHLFIYCILLLLKFTFLFVDFLVYFIDFISCAISKKTHGI